jgi:hypothetical protein
MPERGEKLSVHLGSELGRRVTFDEYGRTLKAEEIVVDNWFSERIARSSYN